MLNASDNPEWNVFLIADMDAESKLRNLCRQLRAQARLGCNFGYKGKPVRYNTDSLPPGFTLLKGGRGWQAWAQVEFNHKSVTKRFNVVTHAAELYAAAAEAIDAVHA